MPTSARWRINITSGASTVRLGIAELTMHTVRGGVSVIGGGTPSASNASGSGAISVGVAFDGTAATYWSTTTGVTAAWLEYMFPGPVAIVEYGVQADTGAAFVPKTWTFEYWDGVAWQVFDTRSNETGWRHSEMRRYPPTGRQFKLLISDVDWAGGPVIIDRTDWLANGYAIDIEKVLSSETFHLSILDLLSYPPIGFGDPVGAYRPTVGQTVLFTRIDDAGGDIELLFGGQIADVTDEPIIDDTGTVTRLRCRDWMILADQVFMPPRTYEAAPVREVFTAIVEEYLGPKGVFVISDPTGGPPLPELRIDDFVTTVRQVLDRITLQCGWPWRINGEKAAGIIEPGELPGPATLSDDGASVLTDPPLRWQQQVLTHATRVFVQTAIPEAGPGPVVYTETVTPPSGTSVVPVHVLPTEIRGALAADAASGATSLSLTGLPKDASIRIGARLTIDTQTTVYTCTSATTTDADGAATVALSAGIDADATDGQSVLFLRGAFVELELDGVVTPMDGSPYVWEPIENAIVYPAGDLGGIAVVYRTWVLHPTMVREWDPVAQQAIGWFDYAAVIDQQITEDEGHTDLETARTFARAELAKRLTPPKRVTCTTRIPGHYPLLLVPMAFPNRQVTGDYLVTETRIRHSTIDERSDEQPLLYELVLMESDAHGESWVQYFRGQNPAQGIRWGPQAEDDTMTDLLSGGVPIPPYYVTGTAPTITYETNSYLDGTTHRYAFIFQAPVAGDLESFDCYLGYAASASPVKFSFQGVDASGHPDGTIGQYQVVTGLTAGWKTNVLTSDGTLGGTRRTVARGDWVAAVAAWDSATTGTIEFHALANGNTQLLASPYVARYASGAWTRSTGGARFPNIAIQYVGGLYHPLVGLALPTSAVWQVSPTSGTTPDEYAIRCTFAGRVRVAGAWVVGYWYPGSMEVVLYDTDGTTVLATHVLDVDYQIGGLNYTYREIPFASPVTLTAGGVYRLAVKPTSGTAINLYGITVPSAAVLGAWRGGTAWHLSTRSDAGAWTDDPVKRPFLGLLIDGVGAA